MPGLNTENTEWFKDWFDTPYYHLLYRNRDYREAELFINKLIEHLDPNPDAGTRILDLACGSGRHSIQLAEKGFEVVGVDLSSNSIAKASEHQHNNLEFFVHDMRLPFRLNYFDYIFNFFTSFGYFETVREDEKAIHSMVKGLKAGGTLVIDYLNPSFAEKNLIEQSSDEIDGIHFSIHRECDDRFFYKLIEIRDDNINQNLKFTERVSKINLNEFETMLRNAGMELIQVFGDYFLTPFDASTSNRMIMIARKKTDTTH